MRHLVIQRDQQLKPATAARQSLRDLLTCYWQSAFTAADDPMRSLTFRATLRVNAYPDRLTELEREELARHAIVALTAWGRCNPHHAHPPRPSPLGAATILAETGDPSRFTHPRA